MKLTARRPVIAIFVGVLIGALLLILQGWLRDLTLPVPDGDSAAWLGLVWNPLNAFVRVAPALVAGALASHRCGFAGAAASAISEMVAFAVEPPGLAAITFDPSSILSRLGLVIGAGIIGFVSGIAGSRTLTSNNSFKPSPLRGLGRAP